MESIERKQYVQAVNTAALTCGVGTRRQRERADEVVFVHDGETGNVIDVFGAIFEVFGYEDKYAGTLGVESLSLGSLPYTVENYLKRLRAAMEGNTQPFLWMARDKAGSSFPVCVSAAGADTNAGHYLLASVRDVSELKQYEKRIQQLGRVLYAFELIDRLVAQEKNRIGFADRVCEVLVDICKYRHALIILLDDNGFPVGAGESGFGRDFNKLFAMIQNGKLSSCCTKALNQAEPVITRLSSSACGTCPLALRDYSNASVITIRLKQEDSALGVLSVAALDGHAEESSDLQFIRKIAEKISLGLHRLNPEVTGQSPFESTVNGVMVINSEGRIELATAEAAAWHGFSSEQLVGLPYDSLVSPGEGEVFNDLWNEVARTGETWISSMHVTRDGGRVQVGAKVIRLRLNGEIHLLITLDVNDARMRKAI